MSARKQRASQTATGTWAADSTVQVNLDRRGAITRIYATARVTPSATLGGATLIPAGLWRIMRNLTIAGGKTFFTLPDDDGCNGGVLLHYLNRWDGHGVGHPTAPITAPRQTFTPLTYVFHAGTRPKDTYGRDNPFDMTAFIPAVAEGQLRADWVSSGNDVLDDAVTITSAVYAFVLCTVQGNDEDIMEEMAAQGVLTGVALPPGVKAMEPAWIARNYPHTQTATSYSDEVDAPAGGWLSHVAMLSQDDTATRTLLSPDSLTGVAIKINRESYNPVEALVEADHADHPLGDNLVGDDAADLGGAAPHAIVVKDLTLHQRTPWGREYGFNMAGQGVVAGDVKVGQTIPTYAAGDDTLFIYRRRLPIGEGVALS